MPRLNFAEETYALQSLPAEAKRLVNLYAESLPQDGRSPYMLRSTPGLVPFISIGTGPIYEMNSDISGRLYLVSGTHFYRVVFIGSTSTVTDLGYVGTATVGTPSIALGVTAVCVCVPPNAFVVDLSDTGTMSQVNDANYPGASAVAYLDGYFVFSNMPPGSQFFCSNLLDGTHYSALNFASAEGRPNVVVWVLRHLDNLYFFGSSGVESWYDAGLVNFPFARVPGSDITIGTDLPHTARECDGGIIYLSTYGTVLRIDGYQVSRISTFAIEEWLRLNNAYAEDPTKADACVYSEQGHWFYCLSIAGNTANRTFVYDTATKRWHERSSAAGGNGFWLGRSAARLGSIFVIGDRSSGQIYSLSSTVGNDNGTQLVRMVTLPPLWADTKRAFMSRLELEMQEGLATVNSTVQLFLSDDGGNTFRLRSDANITPQRTVWTRLGSFRQRILQFILFDICALYAADTDVQEGDS